ncbi:MAG: EAL domain-containing protein [Rubrivivax sp.]|nr:EAL domain-containing protein [Rubrivivax sp.]
MNAPLQTRWMAPPAAPSSGPAALSHELERYRLIFDNAAAGLVLLDEERRILACNRMAEQLLGAADSGNSLLGLSSTSTHWQLQSAHGEPLAEADSPAAVALRTGQAVQSTVLSLLRADGVRRWLSVHSAPLPGEGGACWVLSSFIDVTERIEGERLLEERWQLAQATIAGSGVGLWRADLRTQELFLDEHAARLMGVSLSASPRTQMRLWLRGIHPDDRAQVLQAARLKMRAQAAPEVTEYRNRRADDQLQWLRGRCHFAPAGSFAANPMLLGTVEDITEPKRAEERARHSAALLEALFEQAPIGIQLLDLRQQKVVRSNPGLSRITGYAVSELTNSSPSQRAVGNTQQQRAAWRAELLEQGRAGPHEFEVRHKDGHVLNLVMSGVRVIGPDGVPYAWGLVQDVTLRKRLENQLRAAATRDKLTGLPNRAAMLSHLDQLLDRARAEPGFGFAVFFLDFDRFKLVNDTLGHAMGDELLRSISARLNALLQRERSWIAARFGGDEFVIAAAGLADAASAQAKAEQLLLQLLPSHTISGHDLQSSASIGISLSHAATADSETLLREADTAMYEAKRRGRAQVVLYDEDMHARLSRSVQIESGLRHAIGRGELTVVYQPIIDLATGHPASAEALLRWKHPTLGSISPVEFIPIAEESGRIVEIGEWVLREACAQWKHWQTKHAANAPATISVNLSRVQMLQGPRLIHMLMGVLRETGLPAQALQLEITEREVMSDPASTAQLVKQLRDCGVKLAMDDFGTGSSSLGCLREYPFDTIKVDKSFIADLCRDPQAMAVAHATVSVIENLGMASVAEGVETPDDLAALQALGCRYGQGFLFGRPMLPQAFGSWLDEQARPA